MTLCTLIAYSSTLERWKKHPMTTKKRLGFIHAWAADTEENNQPMSLEEVTKMKNFLKRYNPTRFAELFPDETEVSTARPHL